MTIEKEKMEALLEKAPKEPKGVEKYVRENLIIGRYLIYDKEWGTAVCTHCGAVVPNKYTGMHNHEANCPKCGAKCVCKARGMGRKNLTEYFRLLVYSRKGRTVYAHLWEITADFTGNGRVGIEKWLSAFYTMNADEQHYYKHKPAAWWMEDYWEEIKCFHIPKPPKGWPAWSVSKFEFTYLYGGNLVDVIRRSDLKYLEIDGLKKLDPYTIHSYFGLGLKYQSIELLAKAGFTEAIADRLDGNNYGMLYWSGTSLQKILRLPRRHVRYLQGKNPGLREIKAFQQLPEDMKQKAPWEYIEFLAHTYRPEEIIEEMEENAPLLKTLEYLENQKGEKMGYKITDWLDYMKTARKLGMDVGRNRIRYPENLKQAHDEVVSQWKAEKDIRMDELIRSASAAVMDGDEFEANGLCIVRAMNQEDLNMESAGLNHCVKTYGEKIASGRCFIWFIRKAEEKETPYYTMETDTSGHMRQCRGKHNCEMTEEVKIFAEAFARKLQKNIKEGRVTA